MGTAYEMLTLTPVEALVLTTTPAVAVLVIYAEHGETWAKLYLHGEIDDEVERKALNLARREVEGRGHALERLAVFRATLLASGID
jgi:hypothetical protein